MMNHCKIWGSARLMYCASAFVALILQLIMRNTLNVIILCMTKPNPFHGTCGLKNCHLINETNLIKNSTELNATLNWTRSEQFAIQGTFYYGYVVALPIAGILADKYGGKHFFVHSITTQAIIYIFIPILATTNYWFMFVACIIQGFLSGFGSPSLYQLFSIWIHPSETTTGLSFIYLGYTLGAIITFPLSSFLCSIGWKYAFYAIGIFSLFIGMTFNWTVYNSLEDHPRLSNEELAYLSKKTNIGNNKTCPIPWKSILSSVPIIAFTLTHILHTFGQMVINMMMPRFFTEAMSYSLYKVGFVSSLPFLGACISKLFTTLTCSSLENRWNATSFKKSMYVLCNFATTLMLLGIILCQQSHHDIVLLLVVGLGVSTDISFVGAYWPSLVSLAPSYTGLISGIANSLASAVGFLVPLAVSGIVINGTKTEWNYFLTTLILCYTLASIIYGLLGSSKLRDWDLTNVKYLNEQF